MGLGVKRNLIRLSAGLSAARVFAPSPKSAVTTLCFHRFFIDGEDQQAGLDRLKRQCEWMRANFSPLSPTDALAGLQTQSLPEYPMIVTADDAKLDLLEAHSVFREFNIPLIIFVGVGWAVNDSPQEEDTLLVRMVDFIRWYDGPDRQLPLENGGILQIGEEENDTAIDQVLQLSEQREQEQLERLWEQLSVQQKERRPRRTCNWSELQTLQSDGAEIGSHTVTHIRLAPASDVRLEFELQESKKILEGKFGHCEHFAYPYGTLDSFDKRTTASVKDARYESAFLTNPRFATDINHKFKLPRIVMPDGVSHFGEFRARAKGGAIPLTVLKSWAQSFTHES